MARCFLVRAFTHLSRQVRASLQRRPRSHRCALTLAKRVCGSRLFNHLSCEDCGAKEASTMAQLTYLALAQPTSVHRSFDVVAFLANAGLGRRIVQLEPKQSFFSQ